MALLLPQGIGTKACLNFFSQLAIYSVYSAPVTADAGAEEQLTYTLLVMDVADKNGDSVCQEPRKLVWRGVVTSESDHPDAQDTFAQLLYLPPAERSVGGGALYPSRLSRSQLPVVFGCEFPVRG
jgi:hypothetical protein